MITYEVDKADLKYVRKKLKGMEKKAPAVIKKAINRTAKEARKKLLEGVQQSYTVKAGGFNARMPIENATNSKLYAIIRCKSRTLTLNRFHVTAPKGGAKADIVHKGLKQIIGSRRIKAFKHDGLIMQRETAKRYPVKVLRSNSVSKMLEMVYKGKINAAVEPVIRKTLHEEIEKEIAKLV